MSESSDWRIKTIASPAVSRLSSLAGSALSAQKPWTAATPEAGSDCRYSTASWASAKRISRKDVAPAISGTSIASGGPPAARAGACCGSSSVAAALRRKRVPSHPIKSVLQNGAHALAFRPGACFTDGQPRRATGRIVRNRRYGRSSARTRSPLNHRARSPPSGR